MKRLVSSLLLAATLHAEEITPQQQIEYLQSIIATKDEQIATLKALLQFFQSKPSPQGAAQIALKERLEKQCGGKLDDSGTCKQEKK